ncbi:MAG: MBL fold metallo-hydrolase, partial [Chthoniobacterales bacterium]
KAALDFGVFMSKRVCLLVLSVVLAGCAGSPQQGIGSQQVTRIDALGHMCFLIQNSIGSRILTNPFYPGTTGYKISRDPRPNAILVTNETRDSNNVFLTDASPQVFRGSMAVGTNNATGTTVLGIPTWATDTEGSISNQNLVFSWKQDGMRFAFLGKLQRDLTRAEAERIGEVDLLFMPVGMPSALRDSERISIINQLRPMVIVPMGSSSARSAFATKFRDVVRLPGRSFIISKNTLPRQPYPRVVLLSY